MKKQIYGFDPTALRRLTQEPAEPPFTREELFRLGVPARKIPRVQEELARLAPRIRNRATLMKLARAIEKQLL